MQPMVPRLPKSCCPVKAQTEIAGGKKNGAVKNDMVTVILDLHKMPGQSKKSSPKWWFDGDESHGRK